MLNMSQKKKTNKHRFAKELRSGSLEQWNNLDDLSICPAVLGHHEVYNESAMHGHDIKQPNFA